MTKRHADSDDETYVSVGRPFEFLETAEDVQKAKARKNKDQYVTDDQGRRRFHGAFTGGFSAGYYNTVGSKEALQIHFVNENHWVVSLSMNGVISLYNSGTISDGLAEQLARIYGHLEASIDGWTPSSFVSTRGKRSDYGGQRPEDFMDEEDFGAHGIAPKVVSAQEQFAQAEGERKRPHTDSGVIPGVPPLENLIVPSKSTIGAQILKAMGWREGQGVGPKVLRHQPHQERVYGPARPGNTEVPPSKLSEGYMFAPQDSSPWEFTGKDDLHGLGYHGMEERGVLAPSKATKALYGMKGEAFGTGALEDADDDDENVYGMESMTSYDVSLAGEGDLNMERSFGWTGRESDTWDLSSFTKALKKPEHYKSHPPPCVPKTFVPVHKFKTSAVVNSSLGKPLSSNDRSQLLTDNTGSVFGLMAPSDRERLKNAADKARAMSSSSQAVTELKREQPVAVAGVKSVTEWESKGKERMARAAAIFKPLATSLASRFTRSNENEETPKSPESDAIQAARADMFGALTREMLDWYPHRIVCKRFNVPDPYPGQSLVGLDDGSEKKHKDRVLHFELTEKLVTDEVDEQEPDNDTTEFSSKEEASEQEKEEDESKPPMDLFKAIFATSEDSSSSSDESEVSTTISTQQTLHTEQTSISTQSQSSLFLTGTQNTQKRWQDLSVVTKQVKPPKDSEVLSKSLSFENSQSSESTPSIEKLKLITEIQSPNIPLKPVVASYGPSLPPDVQQPLSSRADHYQKFTLKHSDDPQHVKSKKLHKKHKQEERQHKEHKKKKHRHKKH